MSESAGESSALAPYEAIVAHAELELELAGHGELSELAVLAARWDELIAGLPARAPASAAPVLARARVIHERTRIELLRLRDGLLSDFAGAAQAKRTAEGYAVAAARPSGAVLDRHA